MSNQLLTDKISELKRELHNIEEEAKRLEISITERKAKSQLEINSAYKKASSTLSNYEPKPLKLNNSLPITVDVSLEILEKSLDQMNKL